MAEEVEVTSTASKPSAYQASRSRAAIPCGYHSSTKPGSAQLDVPTRMRPAICLSIARHRLDLGNGGGGRGDLHGLEALRVPGQPVSGGHSLRVPLLDEAGVGPAGCPDEDAPGHMPEYRAPPAGGRRRTGRSVVVA